MKIKNNPEVIVIDLFCGLGGTTTGFTMTEIAYVIACINHDHKAITSHWLNHPEVEHFEEDITKLYGFLKYGVFFKSDSFMRLIRLIELYRAFYPNAKLILWASLECTNFSKAKGGLPRNADSRTLADHLQFYVYALKPDVVQIENVVEFMAWGPLDEKGKPVSKKNGRDWLRWRGVINSFGYTDEWRELNSADYGAYTSRNRLFGMFANNPALICWPEPTHCKKPSAGKLFSAPNKWKPVKEVLDLQDEGNSIFERKKELSDKTLERIYAGLLKYVAGGKDMFIAKYYSGKPEGKVIPVDGPAGTIKCSDGQALIKANYLVNYHHSSSTNSLNDPCPTLVTKDKLGLINTKFLLKYNSTNQNGKHTPPSIEDPCPVIAAQNRLGLINTTFLTKYHGNGANVCSLDDPATTLSTKDRLAKVDAVWLYRDFTNGGSHASVEMPSGAILPNPKLNIVKAEKFIMNTNFNNVGNSIDEPCPTLTASRRHHYILNPAFGESFGIKIYECDTEIMIKIKEFMVLYGIIDVKMRMLKVLELLKIQGFPENYILFGNQTDQKKGIGNSVVPLVVKAWTEAFGNNLKLTA